jgi:ATP synthase protein I
MINKPDSDESGDTGAPDRVESDDQLVLESRRRAERQRRYQQEGEPSMGQRLAQIGVLGWIVILPTLAGMMLGHWLDQVFSKSIFFTAPLLMIGLGLGCWFGWRWVNGK